MKLYLKCVVVCSLILLSSCVNHSPVSKVPKELNDDLASQYYSDKDLIAWQIYLSKRFNLQGLYSKELTDVSKIKDISYVSHFNAIPRDHREPFMKSVYTYLYE